MNENTNYSELCHFFNMNIVKELLMCLMYSIVVVILDRIQVKINACCNYIEHKSFWEIHNTVKKKCRVVVKKKIKSMFFGTVSIFHIDKIIVCPDLTENELKK